MPRGSVHFFSSSILCVRTRLRSEVQWYEFWNDWLNLVQERPSAQTAFPHLLESCLLSIDSRPGARGHVVWCLIIAEPRRPKHLDARANENGPASALFQRRAPAPRTMFQSCETFCETSPPNHTDHPSHQTSTTSPTFRLESSPRH